MIPSATGCNETVGVYHLPPCASLTSSYLFECKSEARIGKECVIFFASRNATLYNTFLIYVTHLYQRCAKRVFKIGNGKEKQFSFVKPGFCERVLGLIVGDNCTILSEKNFIIILKLKL